MGSALRGWEEAESCHLKLCQRLRGLKETKINPKRGKSPKSRNWGGAGSLSILGITEGCSPAPTSSSLVSQAMTQWVPTPPAPGVSVFGPAVAPCGWVCSKSCPGAPAPPVPAGMCTALMGSARAEAVEIMQLLETFPFPLPISFPLFSFFPFSPGLLWPVSPASLLPRFLLLLFPAFSPTLSPISVPVLCLSPP